MIIAIASGKGGTGKTTVATNLALLESRRGGSVAYLDCDVEEPNGHLFLRPNIEQTQSVDKAVPVVNSNRCTHCGRCAEICQFGAIASLPDKTFVFEELCHSCGGCLITCPASAIEESRRTVGELQIGNTGPLQFVAGALNVGEAMSPPVISAVKQKAPPTDLTIIDAPPGTSCPVIESLHGVDFVLLVTEPTPFGLHDLKLAIEMVRAMDLSHAVVINRANETESPLHEYCRKEAITILAELPDDRAVAEAYSRGDIIADAVPSFEQHILGLLDQFELGGIR